MAEPKTPLVLSQGTAYRFVVSTGSRDLGSWAKASDMEIKWGLAEHWVGDSDQYFKYAGVPKYESVKLSRAADPVGTKAVQAWLDEVHSTGGKPEDGAIEIIDAGGSVVVGWTIREMFPISWKISDFDASAGKVYLETLKIAHSGLFSAANRARPA